MAAKHYYPKRKGNQRAFFSNLQSKIVRYHTLLDISPTRQSKIALTLTWLILDLADLDLADLSALAAAGCTGGHFLAQSTWPPARKTIRP